MYQVSTTIMLHFDLEKVSYNAQTIKIFLNFWDFYSIQKQLILLIIKFQANFQNTFL